MKTRFGFVSNSSSSSFIIPKNCFSQKQIDQVKDHINVAKLKKFKNTDISVRFDDGDYNNKDYWIDESDKWNVSETDQNIEFYTHLDNFNMIRFLKFIGIDQEILVKIEGGLQ